MNIKLRDLCETLIVYILLITFQLVHMLLTLNKPDVRRFITWIESADLNIGYMVISYHTFKQFEVGTISYVQR